MKKFLTTASIAVLLSFGAAQGAQAQLLGNILDSVSDVVAVDTDDGVGADLLGGNAKVKVGGGGGSVLDAGLGDGDGGSLARASVRTGNGGLGGLDAGLLNNNVTASLGLGGDGIRRLFCVSGHGDADHNRTIFRGVEKGSIPGTIEAAFVADDALFARIGVDQSSPHALATVPQDDPTPPGRYADVHAGDWETSLMLALNPEVVHADRIAALPPTNLSADDLAEWRKGHDHARRVTPDGYLGDPASASAKRGAADIVRDAKAIAEAIALRLAGKR